MFVCSFVDSTVDSIKFLWSKIAFVCYSHVLFVVDVMWSDDVILLSCIGVIAVLYIQPYLNMLRFVHLSKLIKKVAQYCLNVCRQTRLWYKNKHQPLGLTFDKWLILPCYSIHTFKVIYALTDKTFERMLSSYNYVMIYMCAVKSTLTFFDYIICICHSTLLKVRHRRLISSLISSLSNHRYSYCCCYCLFSCSLISWSIYLDK